MRGTAVPSSFTVWVGLAVLSAALKRECWLEWIPKPLYTNIYVILVAPPSICKKDTIIDVAVDLLMHFPQYMTNDNLRLMKQSHGPKSSVRIVRNEATKQGVLRLLKPGRAERILYELDANGKHTGIPLKRPDGSVVTYLPTSEAVIIAPEIATFIGKETYKEGMIQFLLEMYNTLEQRDYTTESRGKQSLRKLHTVMIGGIQPDVIRDSLPKQAAADGFLSRSTIVLEPRATRRRFEPFTPTGAPNLRDLARRLAWIADHNQGEHRLDPEARQYAEDFYNEMMDEIDKDPALAGIKGRLDTTLRKVALLIKAQRYDSGSMVTLADIRDAGRLLLGTFKSAPDILETVTHGKAWTQYRNVARYIAARKKVDRKTILRNGSKALSANDVTSIVDELRQRGLIEITIDDRVMDFSSRTLRESYRWIGGKDDIPA